VESLVGALKNAVANSNNHVLVGTNQEYGHSPPPPVLRNAAGGYISQAPMALREHNSYSPDPKPSVAYAQPVVAPNGQYFPP